MESIRPQKPEKAKQVGSGGPMQFFEISDIVADTYAKQLANYCTLNIISHNMTFIYYSNIKCARIFQFNMFILYKA